MDQIVVSASKVKQKVTEAPSVVAVVSERNIRRRVGVTDYNRLAAMAKGVDVTYFGSQGAQIMPEDLMVRTVRDLDNFMMDCTWVRH